MLRGSFPGHRRYSITHRAVQRLRELVPAMDELDDEALRDKLDDTLGEAEDASRAVKTLDAMLGEPQVLIPVDTFGELLYAIIKEDTVVTVLPQAHGQEILQRGQALQEKVSSGDAPPATYERERERERDDGGDRWDPPRRRWRRDTTPPVVIQRAVGGRTTNGRVPGAAATAAATPAATSVRPSAVRSPSPTVVELASKRRPDKPVAKAMFDALERGKRRATMMAVREMVGSHQRDASLLPLWNDLATSRVPESLTVGDLIEAIRGIEATATATT
ncbi:MAG: hypothetical protein V3V08_26345 [Nannocystaceae bacterium]